MKRRVPRLAHRDVAKVLDVVLSLLTLRDRSSFIQHALDRLHELVSCDRISYNEMDLAHGKAKVVWNPVDDHLRAYIEPLFGLYMHQHPFVSYVKIPGNADKVYKMSDFISQSLLHRMELYQEVYRHLGTTHQIGFSLKTSANSLVPFALSRGKIDFSERDRAVLSLLSPHLVQALHSAEQLTQLQAELASLRMGLTRCGILVARVSSAGRLLEQSEEVPALLKRYFPDDQDGDGRLPLALREWMRQERAEDQVLSAPRRPLQVNCATHQATIRHARQGDDHVLIIQEAATAIPPDALFPLGLGRREAEVLAWVAQGKTNVEIAIVLGISKRTVQKHLENVLKKLHCETRTAAAATAIEAARLFHLH